MKYTIELDNDEGRGQVVLDDRDSKIKVILPDGTIEDTLVKCTEATFDEYVRLMYGRTPIWDLQVSP